MNMNSCRTDNTHLGNGIEVCETHLTTVINDWAKILDKKGQVDNLYWHSILLPINSLKENCLAME